jgi:hypothetical protein
LSRARESNLQIFAEGNRKRSSRESRVRAQVAREMTMLRQCIDWLEQLDCGECVIVNLRSETDVETESVSLPLLYNHQAVPHARLVLQP